MTATFQKNCVYEGRGICDMGHKGSSRKQSKQKLRVAAVKFVPTPGVQTRLARVYDLLLRERPDHTSPKSESEDMDDDTLAMDER